MSLTVPIACLNMGTEQENEPFCTHSLVLKWAQCMKIYLSVPTAGFKMGTAQEDISLCAHNFRQRGYNAEII